MNGSACARTIDSLPPRRPPKDRLDNTSIVRS